jgi:hypothetical protein
MKFCFSVSYGAGNETRTRDPNLGKVVLYQLSYSRAVMRHKYKDIFFPCNSPAHFLQTLPPNLLDPVCRCISQAELTDDGLHILVPPP